MAEYHVGCGLAGIYAGTIKKPGEWKNKSEVTSEAMRSVAEFMLGKIKPGDKAYEITWINSESGEKIVLTCHREAGDEKDRDNRDL